MAPRVDRHPAWFEDAGTPLFGWYHASPQAGARDLVAVLCPPVGSEYTRSHRTLRHLADRLARAGVPALRFDYHGTGDSPGSDLDPDRLEAWLASIRAATAHARRLSGRTRVCLAGVRLGGTLAALASRDLDPELLVLWNAPAKGRTYLRELQAIAMTAARASETADGSLEAAGGLMTAQTVEAVRSIDLASTPPRARRVLRVARDDLAGEPSLQQGLAQAGVACDAIAVPGWNGMMADHQFTVVPEPALAAIVSWIGMWTSDWREAPPPVGMPGPSLRFAAEGLPDIEERLCRFGADEHLFGVLTRAGEDPGRPAILLFNGGAVHHVGPNRIYVALARRLAAMGFACLRFDLEGIGDSVLRGPGRENHPYPESAGDDARSAVDFLRERFGYRRFVAVGLCSGAHTAFHAALDMSDAEIEELVLINPYAFYWHEGMSLDVMVRMADAQQYRKSARDPQRWLKLLRGEVNFRRLLEVALEQPRQMARSAYGALCEAVAPDKAPPLARDLRRLFAMNRGVTVLLAEGDPGGEIIMAQAPRTASRALRRGQLRLVTIEGADHTFTQSRPRGELIERVTAHLGSRWGEPRAGA